MSFRLKTVLGVGLIEAVLLAILISSSLDLLYQASAEQLRDKAHTTAQLFATTTKDAVLAVDLASLESFVEALMTNPGLRYARVINAQGQVLAEGGDAQLLKQSFNADIEVATVDDGRFDTRAEIRVEGVLFGAVELGFSIAAVELALSDARQHTITIALFELALSALFSILLGLWLTRQLMQLKQATDQLAEGQFGVQVAHAGNDELGRVVQAFNSMSARLALFQRQNTQQQQALQLRTEQLDQLFELSPDGIVLFDAQDRVRMANQAFRALTGVEQSRLEDCSLGSLQRFLRHQQDPSEPALQLQNQAQDDESPQRMTLIDPSSGKPRCTLLCTHRHVQPSVPEMAHLHGVGGATKMPSLTTGEFTLLYFNDISKQSEVDRMKSDFLSTAAHELRTPLASVFGFTELLMSEDYDEPTRQELLSTVYQQAGQLQEMLNELLDLARIEARQGRDFEFELGDIEPLLREVVNAFTVPGDPRKISVGVDARVPDVRFDRTKITQAINNVLSNAQKYSPHGSPIHLRLEHHAGEVSVSIIDAGIGLTDDQRAKVFERFYRVDESGSVRGAGLGLSLVQEILQVHGGRVEIDSEYGMGSTVRLVFSSNLKQQEDSV